MRILLIILFYAVVLFTNSAMANDNFIIATTIKPIELIVQDIVGKDAQVFSVLSENYSAHSSHLDMNKLKLLKDAQLVFVVSKELDSKVYNLPINGKIVELADDDRLKILQNIENKHIHKDEHIWLNPDNAILMAEKVAKEVAKIMPGRTEELYKRLETFKNENMRQVNNFKHMLPKLKGITFYAFHNEFSYLTDYFGLKSFIDLHIDHNDGLSLDKMNSLIKLSGNNSACVVLSNEHKSLKIIEFFIKQKNIKYVFVDSESFKSGNNYPIGYKYAKMVKNIYNSIVNCNG